MLIDLKNENHSSDAEWREEEVDRLLNEILTLLESSISPKKNSNVEDKEIPLKEYSGLISSVPDDLLRSVFEFLPVRERMVLCSINKKWYEMMQSAFIYESAVPFMRLDQQLGTIYLVIHRSSELNRKQCLPVIKEQRIHVKKALGDRKELGSLGRLNNLFFNEVLAMSNFEINVVPSNVEFNVAIESPMSRHDNFSEFIIKSILILFAFSALYSEKSNDPLSSPLSLIFRFIIFATSLIIVPNKTKQVTGLQHHQPEAQLQVHLQNFSRVRNFNKLSHSPDALVNRQKRNFSASPAGQSFLKSSFS